MRSLLAMASAPFHPRLVGTHARTSTGVLFKDSSTDTSNAVAREMRRLLAVAIAPHVAKRPPDAAGSNGRAGEALRCTALVESSAHCSACQWHAGLSRAIEQLDNN